MKKIVLKVISAFSSVLLFLSFIFLITVVFFTSNHKVTTVMGYTLMRIASPSMTPEYPVNSYILIKKINPDILKVGDVITFYSDDPAIKGFPNTHRIKRIETSGARKFITRGDANNTDDIYPVTDDKIIGKVERKIPFLTFVSTVLSNKYIFIFFIVVPILIMLIFETIKLFKTGEEKEGVRK